MIVVELEREDLVRLLKGVEPDYEQMENPFVKENGRFNGSYGTWSWNWDAFEGCGEIELWGEYCKLRGECL